VYVKAGVHKSWAGLSGQLNCLQWSLIYLGSLEVVLCHAVGASSFEVAVMFVENMCTFVIKVTSPRLYLCSVETVLFFNNQSPTESDSEELHKLLKLLSVKVSITNCANGTAECQ
jgi:hypothetical protein